MVQFTGWVRGWKDIAKYLGVCVSTAKKYHYLFAMPVYHKSMGPTILPYEVDQWLQKFNEKAPQKRGFNRR